MEDAKVQEAIDWISKVFREDVIQDYKDSAEDESTWYSDLLGNEGDEAHDYGVDNPGEDFDYTLEYAERLNPEYQFKTVEECKAFWAELDKYSSINFEAPATECSSGQGVTEGTAEEGIVDGLKKLGRKLLPKKKTTEVRDISDIVDDDDFVNPPSPAKKIDPRYKMAVEGEEDMCGFEAMDRTNLDRLQSVLAQKLESEGATAVLKAILESGEYDSYFTDQINYIKNTSDLSDTQAVLNALVDASETLLDDVQVETMADTLSSDMVDYDSGEGDVPEGEYEEPEDWSTVDDIDQSKLPEGVEAVPVEDEGSGEENEGQEVDENGEGVVEEPSQNEPNPEDLPPEGEEGKEGEAHEAMEAIGPGEDTLTRYVLTTEDGSVKMVDTDLEKLKTEAQEISADLKPEIEVQYFAKDERGDFGDFLEGHRVWPQPEASATEDIEEDPKANELWNQIDCEEFAKYDFICGDTSGRGIVLEDIPEEQYSEFEAALKKKFGDRVKPTQYEDQILIEYPKDSPHTGITGDAFEAEEGEGPTLSTEEIRAKINQLLGDQVFREELKANLEAKLEEILDEEGSEEEIATAADEALEMSLAKYGIEPDGDQWDELSDEEEKLVALEDEVCTELYGCDIDGLSEEDEGDE